MNDQWNPLRIAFWLAMAVAQAACAPAPPFRSTASPGPELAGAQPVNQPTNRAAIAIPTDTPPPSQPPPASPISVSMTPPPSPSSTPTTGLTLQSIRMMDRSTGWAIAEVDPESESRILRTTDGGETWQAVDPMEAGRSDALFLDAQTAWAWSRGGGPAWQTLDGGQSWAPVGEFGWQPDLGFVDSLHGWRLNAEWWGLSFVQFDIVSFSTTQDGGKTWHETNPPPGGGVAYMAYTSAQTAWAVRAGFAKTIEGVPNLGVPFHVATTFDGGGSWTARQMPLPAGTGQMERPYEGRYLGGVGNCEFVSPVYNSVAIWKVALTCEDGSWLYTTANQGTTWIISPMPAGLDVTLHFTDPTNGWLFVGGWAKDFQGDLYRTSDGGQNWTLIKRTGWGDVHLSFVDAQTGWAIACSEAFCYQDDIERALVKTTDGGENWQVVEHRLQP